MTPDLFGSRAPIAPAPAGAAAPTDPIAALENLVLADTASDGAAIIGTPGWTAAAAEYQRLMAIWLTQPTPGRALPPPAGIVLEHLHKLDLFRLGQRRDGVIVPMHLYLAAREAAVRLRMAAIRTEPA